MAARRDPVRGAVNVAPTGSISLSRALRLIGRPPVPVPHPLFGPAMARLGGRLGAGGLYGDGVRLLRYGRGVDNTRLRDELGYEPRFDAVAAIRDFAAAERGRRLVRRRPAIGAVAGRLAGSGPVSATAEPDRARSPSDRRALPARRPDRGRRRARSARRRRGARPRRCRAAARGDRADGRRLRGDYHEDEWGFDEEFAEAVYPFFELLYDLVAGRGDRGRQRPRPRPRRCSSPTTPARSSRSTRR